MTKSGRSPGARGSGASDVESDVLIVGAGMVGLTLATALSGAGCAVTLVDRWNPESLTAPGHDGRGSAIAAGSEDILSALGLWPAMAAEAQPILEIRVSDADSPLFLHYDHREAGDRPLGHIVENRVVRTALLDRLGREAGARIVWGREVAALERGRGRATATLDDGARLTARLAVAADGRDSALRREAGIDAPSRRYPQTGIVCTVAHERPHRGIAQERFLPAGPFAILPMTGSRSSIVWTERATLAPALTALDERAFAEELALRFGGHLGRLRVAGPRFVHPLAVVHARRYTAHRLALVGDAAHSIHPIAGQGLNIGLRDAAVLAEVVVDALRLGLDPGTRDALEPYARRRRPDNLAMLAATHGLNGLFSTDRAPVRLARGLGLAAVDRAPPLKRALMRRAMGLAGDRPRLARGRPL